MRRSAETKAISRKDLRVRTVICQRPYRIEYCEKWVLEKSWLPPRDSNPDKQIQNLLSCR